MTTLEVSANLLGVLANKLSRQAERRKVAIRARTWMQSIVTFVFQVAGFSCLTYAGFLWDMKAGYVVAGFSCFALSKVLTTNSQPPMPPRMR